MEITNDVTLRGSEWNKAISNLSEIFKTRTNYSLYILAMTIGIMYDRRIEKPEENGDELKYIPRNVLQNRDNGKLDFLFQAAILSTQTETLTEDQRLELAFGENVDYNRLGFLTQFANYGVTKLNECIGESSIETMENVKNFLFATVEGRNLEIDSLPDEVLLMDP
jgi:hypothetical protein